MKDNIISDYDLQALVDDELGPLKANEVKAFIARNPDARKRYRELQRQTRDLKFWWKSAQNKM
ncbi:anti-sigma factor [Sneathiella sp.]|uniref:anti-sigma factor family protein n=1 Tax=Sneathiella sp. TaxID=1964365 RepID=UPI003568177A